MNNTRRLLAIMGLGALGLLGVVAVAKSSDEEEFDTSLDGAVYMEYHDDEIRVWKVTNLWQAAEKLPVTSVPLSKIDVLDKDFWFVDEEPTVQRVTEHCDRIDSADLRYPIVLGPDGNVLDGGHRAAKAFRLKKNTILARQLTEMPEPDRVYSRT